MGSTWSEMKRQHHLAVGNINLDVTLVIPRLPGPDDNIFATDSWIGLGGAASNYAIAVSRLGHRSSLVAVAGKDSASLGLIKELENAGVDTSHVKLENSIDTGKVVVLLTPGGYRAMVTIRGANRLLKGSHVPSIGDHVHFASVKGNVVEEALKNQEHPTRTTSYDPGGEAHRDPDSILKAAKLVDTILLNEKELESLTGTPNIESATNLLKGRTSIVVVKHGRGGASIVSRKLIASQDPPPYIKPLDVTGAGDAFDAAFNIIMIEKRDPLEALRWAVAAGTAKIMLKGSSNMPSITEVKNMLNKLPTTKTTNKKYNYN
ncbi:MAG: PfkB family carbohydrate kinase [Desulfurococcales archaeon]|nr:PfkB family carbohydrate kinase [Desulfurococcales archaeon]